MRVTRVWLTDFRCFARVEVEPASTTTVLVGGNAQGKTSMLEGVGWLGLGRSFRGVPDAALVREGCERAFVRATVERGGRARRVEAELACAGRTRKQVDGRRVPRAGGSAEALLVTVFSPDDLDLVKGGPDGRRRYLDDLLVATAPRYGAVRVAYERVVRQRNALLKQGVRSADERHTLSAWDDQLVQVGAELARGRLGVVQRLGDPLSAAYGALAAGEGPGEVAASYQGGWCAGGLALECLAEDAEELLRVALGRVAVAERERRQTLVGPHRDEWALAIGGLAARTHASQGEQRSLALALRLAGHAVVTGAVGDSPVLLLDDVFSELDVRRAAALMRHLPDGQTVVTTAGSIPEGLSPERVLRVAGGEVVAA